MQRVSNRNSEKWMGIATHVPTNLSHRKPLTMHENCLVGTLATNRLRAAAADC